MGCCGKSGLAFLAHGAVGLGKAVLRIDRADAETIAVRRDACRVCEFAENRKRKDGKEGLTTRSKCFICKCFIAPKTMVNGEKCPKEKWQ